MQYRKAIGLYGNHRHLRMLFHSTYFLSCYSMLGANLSGKLRIQCDNCKATAQTTRLTSIGLVHAPVVLSSQLSSKPPGDEVSSEFAESLCTN